MMRWSVASSMPSPASVREALASNDAASALPPRSTEARRAETSTVEMRRAWR
jgi:hypothetical protein